MVCTSRIPCRSVRDPRVWVMATLVGTVPGVQMKNDGEPAVPCLWCSLESLSVILVGP